MKKGFLLIIIIYLLAGCKKDNLNQNINSCGTVTDIDGNIYNTVKIGTQCWMKENLKTTHYNDGSVIPTGLDDTAWGTTTIGAYSIYDNNPTNNTTYGKLYNWYAVHTGKLAPIGWHVPDSTEFAILITYLGGYHIAGGSMKDTTLLWESPNWGATNSSGFTALPAGFRGRIGEYQNIKYNGWFWTSTEHEINFPWTAWAVNLPYNGSYAFIGDPNKIDGYSVRCIKD